ncbi:MAG: hypothetical protein ACLTSX_08415 [Collinsella sp.]
MPDETAVYLTAAKRSRLSSNSHAESPLKDELEECLCEETEEEVERPPPGRPTRRASLSF